MGSSGIATVAGTVQTAEVDDAAITNAKLADMAAATVKGRASGAGTGVPTDLTATQATALLNAATTSLPGTAELATTAEVLAGTDTSRIVTPDGVLRASNAFRLRMAPTGWLGATVDRHGSTIANQPAALSTGVLRVVAIWLPEGTTVTNIVFVIGTTGSASPTNWWYAFFDSAGVCLRLTADQTSTAIVASTATAVALSSSYLTTYSGWHYLGMMVNGTVPSLLSVVSTNTANGLVPVTSATADGSLSTPPALPFTFGTLTAVGGIPYAGVT